MFPDRHRRPMRPRNQFHRPMPRHQFQRPSQKEQPSSSVLQIINQFKDDDGQYDFTRISGVISQMNRIYDDISPVIQRFTKK